MRGILLRNALRVLTEGGEHVNKFYKLLNESDLAAWAFALTGMGLMVLIAFGK